MLHLAASGRNGWAGETEDGKVESTNVRVKFERATETGHQFAFSSLKEQTVS